MLCAKKRSRFQIEESIVQFMKSTQFNENYVIERWWNICFLHPYQYLEPPAFLIKKLSLQKNMHSSVEKFGFLLFPEQFGCNAPVPILNLEFMKILSLCKTCPTQKLGKTCDGISLYQSVDVLLKFAASKRLKCAKIAVYKFMEGRSKTRFCGLNEDIEPTNLDPSYDSYTLELCDESSSKTGLQHQLIFCEIFLYDYISKGTRSVTNSCPPQIAPVTLVTFSPKYPYIIPRPVLQQGTRKKQHFLAPKLGTTTASSSEKVKYSQRNALVTNASCSVCQKIHYYNQAGQVIFPDLCYSDAPKNKKSCDRQSKSVQNENTDLVSTAAVAAGIVDDSFRFDPQIQHTGEMSATQQESKHFTKSLSDPSQFFLLNDFPEGTTASSKNVNLSHEFDPFISATSLSNEVLDQSPCFSITDQTKRIHEPDLFTTDSDDLFSIFGDFFTDSVRCRDLPQADVSESFCVSSLNTVVTNEPSKTHDLLAGTEDQHIGEHLRPFGLVCLASSPIQACAVGEREAEGLNKKKARYDEQAGDDN